MDNFRLVKQLRHLPALRRSFMDLAEKVFDLSFEDWFRQGNWTERYIPYSFACGDRVVANASVNLMDFLWCGVPKRYVQIGTVMTDPDYRGRGLSRKLLEEILHDWKNNCECIYLFANSTVLDFYPKFGFQRAEEYKYILPCSPENGDFVKLDMDSAGGRETLLRHFEKSNPYALLSMSGNTGLLFFYCGGYMKNNVYYSEEKDVVCVAEQEGNTLVCHDIFGSPRSPLEDVLSALAAPGTEQAALGFTPIHAAGGRFSPRLSAGDVLFLLQGKENIFAGNRVMFPTLSQA